MKTAGIPGLAMVAIKGDRVVLSGGYGTANFATGAPVTPDTIFNVASISKTIAAVALMQRVEAGDIGLDDDVDTALPFTLRSQSCPNTPITPRMLLSHTAAMADGPKEWNAYVIGHDATQSLRAWLESYLLSGGANYTVDSWWASAPGAKYHYANSNIDVAGEIVEYLAATDLQAYSQANIFSPLGMTDSSWFLAGLDRADLARLS